MSHGGSQSPAAYDRQNLTASLLRTRLSAGSPLDTPTLAYYFQTPIEIDAGITPVDYTRLPHIDVRRYATLADALAVLQEAGSGRLTLTPGVTYTISAKLALTSLSNFVIDASGATIKAANGMAVASGTQLLHLTTCTDFEILGLTVDGNRANRTPAETTSHLLQLTGCTRFALRRVRALNATTDGIRLDAADVNDASTYCSDFLLERCFTDNAYRNGLGIINSFDGLVSGGTYKNSTGIAPQAGADIESNNNSVDPGNRSVIVDGASFTGNAGFGLALSGKDASRALTARGNFFSNNTLGGITVSGAALIEGNEFDGFSASGAVGVDVGASAAARVKITHNTFRNFTAPAGACIDDGSTTGYVLADKNEFLNVVTAIDSTGLRLDANHNEIDTCSGIGISIGSGTKASVTHNRIHAATGRAILATCTNSDFIGNRLTDVASVSGAYLQAEGAGNKITDNTCEASSAQATTIGIRAHHDARFIAFNDCVNLHTTQPYSIQGTESASSAFVGHNSGGTANAPKAVRFAIKDPSFSDGSRPAANTVPVGGRIYNTGDAAPNFSDGANWRDAAGVIT